MPLDVHLAEGLNSIYPVGGSEGQDKLIKLLGEQDIEIPTGYFTIKITVILCVSGRNTTRLRRVALDWR